MKLNPKANSVVWSFYEHLNRQEFQEAWDLLDKAYQEERWESSFKWFKEGYSAFSVIENLQVFPRRSELHLAIYDAFYEEQQMQQSMTPLKVMQDMTVGTVRRDLLDLLDDLESDLAKAGGDHTKFNSIIFNHFFHADAAVALPWELGIDPERLKKVFPIREHKTLSRGRRLRVVEDAKGEWKIKRITWLST